MNPIRFLCFIIVALFVGGVIGYGICAYRVVREQAKEWKRDDD